ncbi:sigma-70 family RNA polymerase sigma factor [soil metagenome]
MFSQTATHTTLIARVRDGTDPAAWTDFCARYGDLIRGFCRRQGLQSADIDDVQQDVLLALTKAMPRFEYDHARGRFRGYLKTAVLHAIYRRARQKRGEARLPDISETSRLAAADDDAERQWEAQWRQYHLHRALARIEAEFAPADREAFEQYAVNGRAAPEVAADLGISVDSVYQSKSRILKRLGAVIEEQVGEEG